MSTIVINVIDNKSAHFWHFCMGEFLPIVAIIAKLNPKKVYLFNPIRDWGKGLDRFYIDICEDDLKIEFTNKIRSEKVLEYRCWDFDWNDHDIELCLEAIKWLKIRARKHLEKKNKNINRDEILIQIRKNNKEMTKYYNDEFDENQAKVQNQVKGHSKYGFDRRGYYDMETLIYLFPNSNTRLCYGDGKNIYDQIIPYLYKKKLILSHGAGMFFIFFMEKGSKIIEIIPPHKYLSKCGAAQGLKRICLVQNNYLKQLILKDKSSVKVLNKKSFSFNHKFRKNNEIVIQYPRQNFKNRYYNVLEGFKFSKREKNINFLKNLFLILLLIVIIFLYFFYNR